MTRSFSLCPCPIIHHTLSQTMKSCTLYTFYAHSLLYAPSYTYVLYPRCTPVNSCYTSFTPTLVVTLYLCYAVGHSMPPTLDICTLPVVYGMHPPGCSAYIRVRIEIPYYCSPSPVRLAIHMHRHTHKHIVYGKLIKCKTLMNEQD